MIKLHNIIITDPNSKFRKSLYELIKVVKKDITVKSTGTLKEFTAAFTDKISALFIDYLFMINSSRSIISEIKKQGGSCIIILLIGGNTSFQVSQLVMGLDRSKSINIQNHILKDNYPREVMLSIVEDVLKQLT